MIKNPRLIACLVGVVAILADVAILMVCCPPGRKSEAPASPASASTAPATATPTPAGPGRKIDGHAAYKKAFDVIVANDMSFASEDERTVWAKEWEGKFALTDLSTLAQTDRAIGQMCASIKVSYVVPTVAPASTSLVGIGIICELENSQELLKDLPKDASTEDAEKAMVISPSHRFTIKDIVSDSPAAKAKFSGVSREGRGQRTVEEWETRGLKAGDKVVFAGSKYGGEQKKLNGLTFKEAVGLIRGPKGSVVQLKVEDVDLDGMPVELQFECVRDHVRIKGAEAKPLTGGAWLLAVGDLSSSDSRTHLQEALKKAEGAEAIVLDLRQLKSITVENLDYVVECFVSQGINHVLVNRQGVRSVSLSVGSKHYDLALLQPEKGKTTVDGAGFVKDRPVALKDTTPLVVLTSEDLAVTRSIARVLKQRKNTVVVGRTNKQRSFFTTRFEILPEFERSMMLNVFEILPLGLANPEEGLVPDVQLTDEELRSNAMTIDAALRAAGINQK